MTMKWKVGIATLLTILVAIPVYWLSTALPISLLQCIGTSSGVVQWACKQSLYHRVDADLVKEMNREAGAQEIMLFKNETEAREHLEFFLARGLDINAVSVLSGATALHLAVNDGNALAVKILLDHGARIDIRDKLGRTPLDLAEERKKQGTGDYASIISMLEKNK
jgi:ankyrin repeat protein